MGKTFDRIDIILIVLISIYLITLVIGVLWIILDIIEKKTKKLLGKTESVVKVDTKPEKVTPPKEKVAITTKMDIKQKLLPLKDKIKKIKENATTGIKEKEIKEPIVIPEKPKRLSL